MLSSPQFQHSKKSGTWYFCVHHETTGSPHITHSVPHQPHTKTNSTNALPPHLAPDGQHARKATSMLRRFRRASALTR
ncbi:hypothetical protein SALBM217S_01925 [Streptomyces griseoloalbus]